MAVDDGVIAHKVSASDLKDMEDGPQVTETENQRVTLTEEDNRRILRETDLTILPILVWVYFLQILDKTVLGYSAIFGLREDVHLKGNQYSLIGSIAPIAQLAWQPFSSILIIKVPHRILMPTLVLGWGIAQSLTPLCKTFSALLAARFFLGLFEAGCLPLFSVITAHWYRRSEQPVRVAGWYGTNGLATIVAAALSFGLAKIHSPVLASWQIIFLFTGLLTIVTVPFVYWKLDNNVHTARFLMTAQDKLKAVERLRANNNGTSDGEAHKFKWAQVGEVFLDVKTYLFVAMSLANNLGAQVVNTFGPLILSGLGFDNHKTTLLNIPFGAVQYVVILGVAWTSVKVRSGKGVALLVVLVPILAGVTLLYVLPRGDTSHTAPLLVGYYFLAFIFGCNTLVVSWILANTAGSTKSSVMMSLFNAASSAGNIIGPLLFDTADAPAYTPGLKATLGVYSMMAAVVLLQLANLVLLNKMQEKKRVANGKPAKLHDASMENKFNAAQGQEGQGGDIGSRAFLDLTDRQNDEFIYVY
ncbi:major facilitator superfamily domain-containing protein [Pseudoneurospora amorphoporcata]|uniref:Major facilitator superfamily domain-containing protein n=1 Tax=Pseudoneurospora amorphoporcata TaxID=241081 RepID=A0AAN6NPW9_9PEZI|nr:major facilitator superfamily domain-containing protein [Pseudoneurospora amorphoporcata]